MNMSPPHGKKVSGEAIGKKSSSEFRRLLGSKSYFAGHKFNKLSSNTSVSNEYFERNGFTSPVVFEKPDAAGLLRVVKIDFENLSEHMNMDLIANTIKVQTQEEGQQRVGDWLKATTDSAFHDPSSERLGEENPETPRQVATLDLTVPELEGMVQSLGWEAPKAVRGMDWAVIGATDSCPALPAHRYCILAPAESFLDFTMGPSGASGFLHVVSGKLTMYMLAPSTRVLQLFSKWVSDGNKQNIFLPQLVFDEVGKKCRKVHLSAGRTIVFPAGWVFALMTHTACVTFGGHFLTLECVKRQLAVRMIGDHLATNHRSGPMEDFVRLHWRAAKHYTSQEACDQFTHTQVQELKALLQQLGTWQLDEKLKQNETDAIEVIEALKLLVQKKSPSAGGPVDNNSQSKGLSESKRQWKISNKKGNAEDEEHEDEDPSDVVLVEPTPEVAPGKNAPVKGVLNKESMSEPKIKIEERATTQAPGKKSKIKHTAKKAMKGPRKKSKVRKISSTTQIEKEVIPDKKGRALSKVHDFCVGFKADYTTKKSQRQPTPKKKRQRRTPTKKRCKTSMSDADLTDTEEKPGKPSGPIKKIENKRAKSLQKVSNFCAKNCKRETEMLKKRFTRSKPSKLAAYITHARDYTVLPKIFGDETEHVCFDVHAVKDEKIGFGFYVKEIEGKPVIKGFKDFKYLAKLKVNDVILAVNNVDQRNEPFSGFMEKVKLIKGHAILRVARPMF